MAEFPVTISGGRPYSFSAYSSGDGIIAAPGSTNTKGSYEAMVNSFGMTVDWIEVVMCQSTGGAGRDFLLDLALGGAGSEQVLLSNLLLSMSGVTNSRASYVFPVHIPVGQVLRCRAQSNVASSSVEIFCKGFSLALPGFAGCQRVETWGANTADSGGTQIDSGGTAGVKGAWTQIVASTSFDVRWLNIAIGNVANNARTLAVGDLDIGIGAGGSERVIYPDLRFVMSAGEDVIWPHAHGPIPVNIPAGSRVAARAVNWSTTDATDRLLDVILYGAG